MTSAATAEFSTQSWLLWLPPYSQRDRDKYTSEAYNHSLFPNQTANFSIIGDVIIVWERFVVFWTNSLRLGGQDVDSAFVVISADLSYLRRSKNRIKPNITQQFIYVQQIHYRIFFKWLRHQTVKMLLDKLSFAKWVDRHLPVSA